MYAIIETGGKQYWVTPGETIRVEKLEAEAGKELTLKALWPADGKVVALVVGQTKGPKIIVFKRRSKKAYKRKAGHRQGLTSLQIKSISPN